jgi:hypothetical protein
MIKASVRRIGNSWVLPFPRACSTNTTSMTAISCTCSETRTASCYTYDPKFAAWVKAYESTNKQYRNTLRELAK